MNKLKARLIALEKQVTKSDWLILDCEVEPTAEQINEMEEAEKRGRTAVLFGRRYDTLWMLGYPKPWEQA